jgi:26S proteasome regulatory subunit N8
VLVIIDVRPGIEGIPTTAYIAVDEVQGDGKEIQRVFKHIPCLIEAEEAEEVFK